jgi:hypothetical protein
MATGPRNYTTAQQLIVSARDLEVTTMLQAQVQANQLAAAQVLATLALTAATALGGVSSGDWQEVILRDKASS